MFWINVRWPPSLEDRPQATRTIGKNRKTIFFIRIFIGSVSLHPSSTRIVTPWLAVAAAKWRLAMDTVADLDDVLRDRGRI